MAMHVLRVATLAIVLTSGSALAKAPGQGAPLFSTPVEACIIPAARYHSVNEYVLRSILKVESGLNPSTTVSRNTNGTVDVGICQFNSMHFKRLARYNIAPGQLLDPCICTYVAAWHLAEVIRDNGNTWEGIARYHSGTPYFNQRYQVLLSNELIRSGVIQGEVQPVPPFYKSPPFRLATSATAPATSMPKILLSNELIRSGVIQGEVQPVPPLYKSPPFRPATSATAPATSIPKSVVFDGAASR